MAGKSTLDACPSAEVLEEIALGSATDGAAQSHVSTCARCQLQLTEIRKNNSFLDRESRSLRALRDAPPPPTTSDFDLEAPGRHIGPYKLLSSLGEGGFGSVFLAQQESPVRRRVALKVIKLGMDTKQVIARFDAERQALAIMNHPGIAKVFDAGATSTGRPYFVMELVQGVFITRYCDANNLSTPERLALFIAVCHAVQHAHHKGIIHRDIKASNVLVTLQDGEPIPKVIDFGIAKAMNQRLTERTLFTEFHQIVGTPEYMSPEQADMPGLDVDTRSDVYSLGVLLYELLVGATPFDTEILRSKSYTEMQRMIREDEPPRPSTRFASLGPNQTEVARHRRADSADFKRTLTGDLDAIVMKCLEKERSRRYDSPNALAADISRYLAHEPVHAAPPSTLYRARMFAKRHKGAVAAGAVVAASLLLATAVSLMAKSEADRQREAALKAAARATSIKDFLLATLRSSDPGQEGTQDMLVGDALLRGVQRLRKGALSDEPQVKAEIMGASASILDSNGKSLSALPLAEEALSINRGLHPGDHADVATAMNTLAAVYLSLGRAPDAEPLLLQALQMRQRLFKEDSRAVAASLNDLAGVRIALGRDQEAEAPAEQALAMYRRLFPGDSFDVAGALNNLASVRQALGNLTDAGTLFQEALDMKRRLFPGDHPEVSRGLNNLARLRNGQRRYTESEPLYQQALEMSQRLYKGDHPAVAAGLNNLAAARRDMGRVTEAEPLFEQSLAMNQRLFKGDHPDLVESMTSVARVRHLLGKTAESRQMFEDALAMLRRLAPQGTPRMARILWYSGSARLAEGDPAGALPQLEEALAIAQHRLRPDHPDLKEYQDTLTKCHEALKH